MTKIPKICICEADLREHNIGQLLADFAGKFSAHLEVGGAGNSNTFTSYYSTKHNLFKTSLVGIEFV